MCSNFVWNFRKEIFAVIELNGALSVTEWVTSNTRKNKVKDFVTSAVCHPSLAREKMNHARTNNTQSTPLANERKEATFFGRFLHVGWIYGRRIWERERKRNCVACLYRISKSRPEEEEDRAPLRLCAQAGESSNSGKMCNSRADFLWEPLLPAQS